MAASNRQAFIDRMRTECIALTFDDVRLRPAYSEVLPAEVDISSCFSRNVSLKIPLVSAAMDTVTEYRLAIALAQLGGIGILHKLLTPKEQASQVARVKYHIINGMIPRPICVHEDDSIANILAMREAKHYSFSSFLVVDVNGRLVGVLSGNDFEFCLDNSLLAKEVMSSDVITAPKDTTPEDAFNIMIGRKRKLLPVVDCERMVVGLFTFSDLKRNKLGLSQMFNVDSQGRLRVGAAVGVGQKAVERASLLCVAGVDVLVVDTAHGNSRSVIDTVRLLKRHHPSVDIVAGNVDGSDGAKRLIDAGADGIKVGIGPGAICTTRMVAGVGTPQVTAVIECAEAAERNGIPVCSDGGIKHPGDIAIAAAAGAHSVMLGGLLAGTKESPGETFYSEGRPYAKQYDGMGSLRAMTQSPEARERYNQLDASQSPLVPQGVEGRVPYKGPLAGVVHQLVGGLRAGMGYTGSKDMQEMRTKTTFVRVTQNGQAESHPRVDLTKEPPNYWR